MAKQIHDSNDRNPAATASLSAARRYTRGRTLAGLRHARVLVRVSSGYDMDSCGRGT